jgi:SAM-dependent methyltransferase
MSESGEVAQHYEKGSLVERLRAAISKAGLGEKQFSSADLAPLDQFHSRGLIATVELAQALKIAASDRVLDIGSGLGGPSRYLAEKFGCVVQGIDLSQSFVDAANFLAERTGLDTKVSYQQANALSLPFDDETFDVAWTQHVAMNISDRAALYKEAFRVLRSGGRLGIYDVVSVSCAPLHYPVPWASGPGTSFLVTANDMCTKLGEQGFRIASWTDCTEAGIVWFSERQNTRPSPEASPAIGIQLVMGPDFGVMTGNLLRNLREGRAALIQTVWEKP